MIKPAPALSAYKVLSGIGVDTWIRIQSNHGYNGRPGSGYTFYFANEDSATIYNGYDIGVVDDETIVDVGRDLQAHPADMWTITPGQLASIAVELDPTGVLYLLTGPAKQITEVKDIGISSVNHNPVTILYNRGLVLGRIFGGIRKIVDRLKQIYASKGTKRMLKFLLKATILLAVGWGVVYLIGEGVKKFRYLATPACGEDIEVTEVSADKALYRLPDCSVWSFDFTTGEFNKLSDGVKPPAEQLKDLIVASGFVIGGLIGLGILAFIAYLLAQRRRERETRERETRERETRERETKPVIVERTGVQPEMVK